MKILQFFLMSAVVAGLSFNASAQSIKDKIDAGTYYQDENYVWYEFLALDDIDAPTSSYNLWAEVATTLTNGWLLGWPASDYGCELAWDPYGTGAYGAGLVTYTPKELSDNGYPSLGLKVGTPQVKLNVADYPIVAIKFSHLPECGPGGWQDGKDKEVDPNSYYMYGGLRYSVVERAETASTGTNSDFFMWAPRNNADAVDMSTTMGFDYTNWLTIYNPNSADIVFNDPDAVYVFDLTAAVPRNNGNAPSISSIGAACIDMYIGAQDILSADDYIGIEWVRSFYDLNDALDYVDDLYLENGNNIASVKNSDINVLSVDGKIIVNGVDNATIEVYNLQGRKVAYTQVNEVEVAGGIYVVNVTSANSTQTFKVVNN